MTYMGEIGSKGAEIYRYLNFDQVPEYREVADQVKMGRKNPLSFWERDCNSSEHEQEEIT
jgi:hypothetical protein